MAWPEDTLTADESVVTKFRPHWKLLFVPFGFFLLGLIALFIIFQWIPGSTTVDLVLTGLVIVALLILVVKPLIDWYFTWYVLTTERLITRSGVIARHASIRSSAPGSISRDQTSSHRSGSVDPCHPPRRS